MTQTLPRLEPRLSGIIDTLGPRSILCLGSRLEPPASWAALTVVLTPSEAIAHLTPDRRYDLALVDSQTDLQAGDAEIVLARLRDLSARHVLIASDAIAAPPWTRHALVALGYVHLGECTTTAGDVSLFEFDISTYKNTPDWLNPRNWASPELWDRYRW